MTGHITTNAKAPNNKVSNVNKLDAQKFPAKRANKDEENTMMGHRVNTNNAQGYNVETIENFKTISSLKAMIEDLRQELRENSEEIKTKNKYIARL